MRSAKRFLLVALVLLTGVGTAQAGTVVGWGWDYYGQATPPPDLRSVVAVAAGERHSLALRADGTVIGWGSNNSSGGAGPVYQATPPSGLSDVVAIDASNDYGLALKSDGSVVSWGTISVPPVLTDAIAIAAGSDHCLALRIDRTVVNWGQNFLGRNTPPAGLTGVVAVSAGPSHSLALKPDGSVVAWGNDIYGLATVPVGLGNVIAVSAGADHNLALKSDGTVVAWGNNTYGQISVPQGLVHVTAIGAGKHFSLALKSDGTVVAWGRNHFGQTNLPAGLADVSAIAAGGFHGLALVRSVAVDIQSPAQGYTYFRADGAIPVGFVIVDDFDPQPEATMTLDEQPFTGSEIDTSELALGAHTFQVATHDSVGKTASKSVTFTLLECDTTAPTVTISSPVAGRTYYQTDSNIPVTFTAIDDYDPQPIVTMTLDGQPFSGTTIAIPGVGYGDHTFQVSARDGSGNTGLQSVAFSLFYNDTTPPSIQILSPTAARIYKETDAFITVSVTVTDDYDLQPTITQTLDGQSFSGSQISVAGLSHGSHRLSIVARDGSGNEATQSVVFSFVSTQANLSIVRWGNDFFAQHRPPEGLGNVTAVSAGSGYNLALRADGTVAAWGDPNNLCNMSFPAGLSDIRSISAGLVHSLALRSTGTVVAWGENYQGQAQPPSGLGSVIAVSAGGHHSLALKCDGKVVGWGDNSNGQATPTTGLAGVVAIAAGGWHSLALRLYGTVSGWGNNYHGQAIPPQGLTNVVAVAAGVSHSLALKADGTVVGWGSDAGGEATPPPGLTGVVAIDAGNGCSFALKSDGTLVGWGDGNVPWYGGYRDIAVPPPGLSKVVAISTGSDHALALYERSSHISLSIQSPLDGGCYANNTGEAIPIRYTVTDDLDPQPQVTVSLCGQPITGTEISAMQAGGMYGSYMLHIAAEDRFGNVAIESASFEMIYYYEPPQPHIYIESPASRTYYRGDGPIPIVYYVYDAYYPEDIRLDGEWLSGSEIDVSNLSIGNHTLEITAHGYGSTTESVVFMVADKYSTARDAKIAPDGAPVDMDGAIVSAAFADFFYIEADNRTCGIRVNRAGHSLEAGMRADIIGVVGIIDGELCVNASEAVQSAAPNDRGSVGPLALPNQSLGGGAFGAQSGVWGWVSTVDDQGHFTKIWGLVSGANNIGLLVKTWGKFTKTGESSFSLDDGSGSAVECLAPPDVTLDPLWTYAVATGVSSCHTVGGELHKLLRVTSISGF